MAKKGKNQAEIGNFYNSEEYYEPAPMLEHGPIRYFFTGDNCSCALNLIEAGLPPFRDHHHPHEQFCVVLQGDGKAVLDGKEYDGEEGFFMYCPPDVPHNYQTTDATLTCWNLDIFYPARPEYEKETFYRMLAEGKDPMNAPIRPGEKE